MNVPNGFKRLAAESGSTPDRVRERLLAEVRLRRAPTQWWPWAAAAALAAAAVTVLIFGQIQWTRKPGRPSVEAPAASAKTSPSVREQISKPAIVAVAKKPAIVRRKTPAREPILTPFVALPGADMLAPVEDERIVRVQMERGMLRELGFLNIEARDQSLVQADFVLGQDGLARAVRFVRY